MHTRKQGKCGGDVIEKIRKSVIMLKNLKEVLHKTGRDVSVLVSGEY